MNFNRHAFLKLNTLGFYVFLLFFSAVLIFFGAMLLNQAPVERVEVSATISNIDVHYSGDETHYDVYVNYTDLDGGQHDNIAYNTYWAGMKVGDQVTVLYDVNDPENIASEGDGVIKYVMLCVGGVLCIFALYSIVKTVKTKREDYNQYDQTDYAQQFGTTPDEIRADTETCNRYYYHFDGKLNQGAVLETTERTPVFKFNCKKMGILSASDFTFENCLTMHTEKHQIGHTVTTGYNGFASKFAFKIDGQNCWEYLGKRGYGVEPHLQGLAVNFDLLHLGVKVGSLTSAGTNLLKDGAKNKLGNLAVQGIYQVECTESDVEGAALACFMVSRTEFFFT